MNADMNQVLFRLVQAYKCIFKELVQWGIRFFFLDTLLKYLHDQQADADLYGVGLEGVKEDGVCTFRNLL